ncbi:MAG: hypothetical protein LBF61_13290 [Azoarcus sp.]|nr:hypothetical protein [Azoarcus sp.]
MPINPEANRLSAGHKAASGNRSDSRYGGNCTPDEFDKLEGAKKEACNAADTLGKCTSGMTGEDKVARIAAYGRCARARENVMNQCFAGGDKRHHEAAGEKWLAAKNCGK